MEPMIEKNSYSRGQNVLKEGRRKTAPERFLEQLNDPLIFILFIAAAISLLLREYGDASIILAVIFMNAFVGVMQEGKAQKALDALKEMTSPRAIVLSHGQPAEIAAADLIPGDIVLLEAGRQVPADLRLIEAHNLKIEESALTGESLPVEKDTGKNNLAFMSTSVTYGRGSGVVTAIGMDTEIGKIARMIDEAPSQNTPLQRRLADLGKLLGIVSLSLCALLFLIAVLQKRDIPEMLITAISLAVAAVPEGLPAIVTMVLALSVSRMVSVGTIIKRLPSVETLGCVDIICSDKTGTLTQNKMTVTECFTDGTLCAPSQLSPMRNRHFLAGFCLCNDAVISMEDSFLHAADDSCRIGEPTELALADMAALHGFSRPHLERDLPRIGELSFDSDRKMMTTLHRDGSSHVSYTKGSPDAILLKSRYIWEKGRKIPFTESHRAAVYRAISQMSARALRILAIGMREGDASPCEENLTFLGLAGMKDPIRPEALTAIDSCRSAGIRTVMITGDRVDTACAIAKELHIAENLSQCMTGDDLDGMEEAAFAEAAERIRVFAQVSPSHKTKLVTALKKAGHIVAMTGDGVNDAPSLKSADVGIAMGITGTDVAKNASDMILTDDNFSTIVKAVEQGRSIYANIRKSVLFLLSSNFGEILTMLATILAGLFSPLKPSHILWINLITDSLPALALGVDESDTSHFMKQPPRHRDENLFAGGGLSCTLFYGCLIGFISIFAYLIQPIRMLLTDNLPVTLSNLKALLSVPDVLACSQTYAFTALGMSQLFHAIGMRDVDCSLFRMNHLKNKLMLAAIGIGLLLQLLVTTVPRLTVLFATSPLSMGEWGFLLLLSALPLAAHESFVGFRKIRD